MREQNIIKLSLNKKIKFKNLEAIQEVKVINKNKYIQNKDF